MTIEKYFTGNKKTALVIGVNGQDGSYLAEHLKNRNWNVVGFGRQKKPCRVVANYLSEYCSVDITDDAYFRECISKSKPDIIFHTAAIHGPAGFKYEDVWMAAHGVNTLSVQSILEYARTEKTNVQIVYFSSAKAFGNLHGKFINEESPKYSQCIYSITKNSASNLISYYRKSYGINASVIWLFNHESERRSQEYFVIKIVNALKNSLENSEYSTRIGSLDFWCDWGSSSEYMSLLAEACTSIQYEDYILATGQTVWARDIVKELFCRRGLSVENHIKTDKSEIKKYMDFWTASNEKFKLSTGFSPAISGIEVFEDVFTKMQI